MVIVDGVVCVTRDDIHPVILLVNWEIWDEAAWWLYGYEDCNNLDVSIQGIEVVGWKWWEFVIFLLIMCMQRQIHCKILLTTFQQVDITRSQ